jgi:hypothetical protein
MGGRRCRGTKQRLGRPALAIGLEQHECRIMQLLSESDMEQHELPSRAIGVSTAVHLPDHAVEFDGLLICSRFSLSMPTTSAVSGTVVVLFSGRLFCVAPAVPAISRWMSSTRLTTARFTVRARSPTSTGRAWIWTVSTLRFWSAGWMRSKPAPPRRIFGDGTQSMDFV